LIKTAELFRLLREKFLCSILTNEWWHVEAGLDWPAPDTAIFERVAGSVLVQNTAWRNVQKAICNLRSSGLLDPKRFLDADEHLVAELVRPAGFVTRKPKTLRTLAKLMLTTDAEKQLNLELRTLLLNVKGVGPETADTIMVFAFNRAVFPASQPARRVINRFYGVSVDDNTINKIPYQIPNVSELKTFHALLVEFASNICTKNKPKCVSCSIRGKCNFAKNINKIKKL
jgi:endonuclease-3 related protein